MYFVNSLTSHPRELNLFMINLPPNLCTRCGKERIESKSWEEEATAFFGSTTIVHTEMVCPDAECQKIVEEKMDALRQRTEDMRVEKEKRKTAAAAVFVSKKAEKAKELAASEKKKPASKKKK